MPLHADVCRSSLFRALAGLLCLSLGWPAGLVADDQARRIERVKTDTAAAGIGARWAVVVGVDNYQTKGIEPLSGAVADARAIRDVLVRYAEFPESQVTLLVSDGPDKPTAGTIMDRLDAIRKAARPADLLLFFFAGHGVQVDGQRYLLTYEADIASTGRLKTTSLAASALMQELESIRVADRVIMVDACRNDPTKPNRALNVADEAFENAFTLQPSSESGVRATFLSSSKGQSAYEWTDKHRGFFSYFIERGLSGEAAQYGKVTVTSLLTYLNEMVPQKVREQKNQLQVPYAKVDGAELVLVRSGKLPAQTATLDRQPPGASARTIYGVVKDSAGVPLPGVTITVALAGGLARGAGGRTAATAEQKLTTDEDGFFKADGVAPDSEVRVTAAKDSYLSRTLVSAAAEAGKKLVVFLPRLALADVSPGMAAAAMPTLVPRPLPQPQPATATRPAAPNPPATLIASDTITVRPSTAPSRPATAVAPPTVPAAAPGTTTPPASASASPQPGALATARETNTAPASAGVNPAATKPPEVAAAVSAPATQPTSLAAARVTTGATPSSSPVPAAATTTTPPPATTTAAVPPPLAAAAVRPPATGTARPPATPAPQTAFAASAVTPTPAPATTAARAGELALVAYQTFLAEDFRQAETAAREALRVDPDSALANAVLGNAMAALGANSGDVRTTMAANEFITRALSRDPALPLAHNALALTLMVQGHHGEAVPELQKAIQGDPKLAAARANLAYVLRQQNKLDEAVREYKEAIRLDPDSAVPYNGLSAVLFSQGKYKDAIKACRDAISRYQLRDRFLGLFYVQLAVAQYQQGRRDEAMEAVGRAKALGVAEHEAYATIEKGRRNNRS